MRGILVQLSLLYLTPLISVSYLVKSYIYGDEKQTTVTLTGKLYRLIPEQETNSSAEGLNGCNSIISFFSWYLDIHFFRKHCVKQGSPKNSVALTAVVLHYRMKALVTKI